ncbi:MAG TPA: CARDB domain-containing protein, partial [Candidatus Saccharimonadales bacterium]|nr:CARDB domain-containing protein [Candidatus Saccharimonadales bacterium]
MPRRDQLVTVSAAAAGYGSASAAVTVLNSDPSQLSVQLAATTVIEGGQVAGTISRSGPTDAAVMVHLAPVGHQRFLLPDQVIIPAGATSTNFILLAQDDTQLQPQGFYTMTATAAGFVSGSAGLLITDNDLAEFTLSFTLTNLAENAGPNAAIGTISRGAPSPRSLEIDLQSSTPGVVSLPARVVIASGQSEVSFGVTPVNNTATDGTRTTEIRAFALATQSGERLVPSNPVTLTVADDDGPALSLIPAKKLVAEGLPAATTITVSLSLVTNQPVTVHLVSSLPAAATVPATVLVPAGQQNASFALTTLNDQASEGNREVVISATANGFVGGSTAITISDLGLPDLVVEELNGPEAGESEAFVNVSYRVANRGFAPAGTNWTTRLYLSDDPLPGNDIYLTDYAFNGTLPVGEFFGQARQIRLPQAAGDYWLVVVTDTAEQIEEALENNNVSVAARPIHVVPAYQATVSSDLESAPAGTPVPLHGLATRTSTGGPAPFVLVNLHIYLRGTKRIISALTDSTGHFATTFTPLPGEAGFYEIGAAHPGVATASIQDSFTLFGLQAAVPSSPLTLVEGATATGQIAFVNLGELPLHGLAVSVFAQPANMTATATLNGSAVLSGFETNSFNFSITAQDASITSGTVTFRLTTTEGAQLDVPVSVAVEALRARLMAIPESLEAGMKVGGQAFVQFDIANLGGLTSEPVHIALPSLPWLRVITPNPLPGLAPGETNHVTLQLTPAADMNLGAYNGWLGINAGNAGTTLPFIFRALSEAKGDLLVTAVDEYTYFAEGSPKVAGASVTVRDAVTGQIVTNGVTGPDGQFFAGQLEEAYYAIELRADKHRAYRSTQLLGAGKTNEVLAFMGREAVQLIWTVTPTEIQDRTRITIETIFEAYVPMPVVTVDPPLIDLHDFTADVTQIDLRVSNHGLIAAQDAKLHFGTHPDWSFEPLIHDLGDLPARSTLTIPLLIRRTHASPQGAAAFAAASGGGPCTIS